MRNNLDRFAATLREHNTACAGGGACPLEVRGILDAAFAPDRELLDYTETTLCADRGICSFEEQMELVREVTEPMRGARVDESCDTWHAANMPGGVRTGCTASPRGHLEASFGHRPPPWVTATQG